VLVSGIQVFLLTLFKNAKTNTRIPAQKHYWNDLVVGFSRVRISKWRCSERYL